MTEPALSAAEWVFALRFYPFNTPGLPFSQSAFRLGVLARILVENEFQFHFQLEEECRQKDLVFVGFS